MSTLPVPSMTAQSRFPHVGDISMVGAHRPATPLMATSRRGLFPDANSVASTHRLTDDGGVVDSHETY